MEIKHHERVVEERHAITVDTIAIPGTKRVVFKFCEESTRTGQKPVIRNMQGVCTTSQLTKLRAGQKIDAEGYMVTTDEERESLVRFGVAALAANDYAMTKKTNVFDHLAEGGSFDNLVRFYSYDHTFWNVSGEQFPTGIHFDYISAQMHNKAYRLKRVVEVLREREDVTILAAQNTTGAWMNKRRAGYRDMPPVAEPGEEIDEIPSYNAEGGRERCITFFWTPTLEQMKLIKASGSGLDKFKVIFEHDMLGLRAGGATKFEDFYSRTKAARPTEATDAE